MTSTTITIAEIEKLANLSRMALSQEEKETFAHQLGPILDYVNQIKGVVTGSAGRGTVAGATPQQYPHRNVLRPDVDNRDLVQDTAGLVSSAPSHEDGLVKVKKILNN